VSLIGATVVLLLECGDLMVCGWAGDSRAYRSGPDGLERISQDHSAAQEMMDTGVFSAEQLLAAPQASAITRAVGGGPRLVLDWKVAQKTPGARFLLCSDGLTKEMSDAQIAERIGRPESPQQLASGLVTEALARGGRDNVTVLVIEVPA